MIGDRWIAGDPGLVRFHAALRSLLTVVLLLGLALLAPHSWPFSVPLAGVDLGLMTVIMVNNPTRKSLLGTFPAAAPVCALGFALGALVPAGPLRCLAFAAIIWLGVYARKWGPAGNALGSLAFMSFFMAQAFHTPAALLPWTCLCIVFGVAVAAIVRLFLLPDRPDRILKWTMRAFQARVRLLLAASAAGRPGPIHRALARLNETGLSLDRQLQEVGAEALRQEVMHSELAAGRVADYVLQGLPYACDSGLGREDWELPVIKAGRDLTVATFRGSGPPAAPGRLALQAALAGSLALLAGEWISPDRWYWAAVTAYLTFTQVQNTGDTLARAFARTLGTTLGVVVGTLLAEHLHQRSLEITAILVFILAAYYLLYLSYAGMIACVTVVLAQLYNLLGRFTPQLMELRLELTLVGALIGSLVAWLVFPQPTWRHARQQCAAILELVADLFSNPRSYEEVRQIDSLLLPFRRVGSAGTGILLPLPGEGLAELISSTARLAFCVRHWALADSPAEPELADFARSLAGALRGEADPPVRLEVGPEGWGMRCRAALNQALDWWEKHPRPRR